MKNKILVIEDDRAISELLCMNLTIAGYETVAAYDGIEAQRLLLWNEDADLAVVDIMLPGKDGFALMEDFRAKNLPVIYLTAKDDVASKVKGLKLGAEDYMVKPFEMLELLVRIEKSLKEPAVQREFSQSKYSGRSPEPSDSERWDSRKPETTGIRSLYPALTEQKHRTWKRRTIKTCLGRRISGREQNCRRAYRPAPQETGVVR